MERAAVVAPAFGLAAAVRVERQRSREDRPGGGDFAQPAVEHTTDARRVVGDVHGGAGADRDKQE